MANEYLNNKNFESLISKFITIKRNKVKFETLLEEIKETEKRTSKRTPLEKPEAWDSIEKGFDEYLKKYNDLQVDLTIAFYLLSENIVRYRKFNLIDADDAIQEGVMICFEKVDRFDPSKGKAFNYMTTCIINHFRQLYRTARNYNELKRKYHEHLSISVEQVHVSNNQNKGNYKNNYSDR
jgi:DNA-directed RNA polymerase specialized sigma subunit